MTGTAGYDRLAPHYHWLEKLVFATTLQRCRTALLPRIAGSRRVLFFGDGDGRLLRAFLDVQRAQAQRSPSTSAEYRVDVVDLSEAMNCLSRARLHPEECDRVRYHAVDARDFPLLEASYDAIVTPFFLDGFALADTQMLMGRMKQALRPGGLWLDVDFHVPARGWRRQRARLWLYLLYKAFGLTTGMKTNELVQVEAEALADGWQVVDERRFSADLLVARLFCPCQREA